MKTPLRLLCSVFLSLVLPITAVAQAFVFSKTSILPETEFMDNGVTADQINAYFKAQGSQLADYVILPEYEVLYPVGKAQWETIVVKQEWLPTNGAPLEVYHDKTVAQLIVEWSRTSQPTRNPANPGSMNPLIAVATLDKESGAITGTYKGDILSRTITMGWLAGYGYNDRMNDCVKNGNNCDPEYNRQRAIWYGGIGQQIVEMIAGLKRWTANPTLLPDMSCGSTWKNQVIQGECLTLENSLSYAFYRYTPTFSGNQLFITLYNRAKSAINPPPVPPEDLTKNDTTPYTLTTYGTKVALTGFKSQGVRASEGSRNAGDIGKLSWEITIDNIPEGKNTYAIQFKKSDGTLVNEKLIQVTRRKQADANGDGRVDISDLSIVASSWQQTDPENQFANLNPEADNVVDILDLSLLAEKWGK